MPFSLTCPNASCSAKLKTPTAIPFGRKVQCPKCKNPFTVDATNLVEVPADPASASTATNIRPVSAAAPPTEKRALPSAEPASAKVEKKRPPEDEDEAPRSRRKVEDDEEKPVRAKRRDDDADEEPRSRRRGGDDEENEAPRSSRSTSRTKDDDEAPPARRRGRRDDENGEADEETPRSRRRTADDDDEAPRARRSRSRDEDEEEEAPRSRRRSRDDDDDDSPRSRRSSSRDDDDDDAPRSRRRGRDEDDEEDLDDDDYDRPRRRGRKSGNTGKMIAMIAGGALLVGGLIFLMIYLLSGGSYDKEMMAYMPSDSTMIVGVNVEEAMDVDTVKEMVQKAMKATPAGMDQIAKSGVKPEDISKVLVGGNKEGVFAVRFKNNPDVKKLAEAVQAKEEKHKDKTFYKGPMGSFFFPSDSLLVSSSSESVLKKLIEKDNSDIVISEDLNLLAKKVAKSTVWVATSDPNKMRGVKNDLSAGPGGSKDVSDAMNGAKGGAVGVSISSSRISFEAMILCKDSESASKASESGNKDLEDFKKAAPMLINMGAANLNLDEASKTALKDAVNSIEVSSSGAILKASGSLEYKPLSEKLKGDPNLMNFLR